MISRKKFGGYAVRDLHLNIKMIISLFLLLAQVDPTLAVSVRRSLEPYHPNLDAEPYGIIPPSYPYDPHPLSTPESIVQSSRPIFCNNQTEYECVCMKPYSSPHSLVQHTSSSPDCSVFIKTDDLPVVDMRMRQVNTEAKLYTGDSYEVEKSDEQTENSNFVSFRNTSKEEYPRLYLITVNTIRMNVLVFHCG
uniref:CUB domain-containing protein n=1 Tax=Caenorhabditis tropicalis TaxID=1561998 RepID=A0A1I7UZ28_9PELO